MAWSTSRLANRMIAVGLISETEKQSTHVRARNFVQGGIISGIIDLDHGRKAEYFDDHDACIAIVLLKLARFGIDKRSLGRIAQCLRSSGELHGHKTPLQRAINACRDEAEQAATLILRPTNDPREINVAIEVASETAPTEAAQILADYEAVFGQPEAELRLDVLRVLRPFVLSLGSAD